MTQNERVAFKRNVDILEFKNYVLSHSDKDTADHYNIPVNLVRTTLDYHKVRFTREEKHKRFVLNCFDNKGMSYEEYKTAILNRRKQTFVDKYGENYKSIFYNNQKKTMQEKYGVDNPSQVHEFREKVIKTNIEKFGAPCNLSTEETKQRIKETCLLKYGVENYSQTDDFRDKYKKSMQEHYGVDNGFQSAEIQAKSKQTCLEKYGVPFASQSDYVKDKARKNSLLKYGTEHPIQSEVIKNRTREKLMSKYGVPSTLLLPEVQQRAIHTSRIKYGVDNPSQSEIVKEHIKETNRERYGVDWFCTLPKCRMQGKNNSAPNRKFKDLLKQHNVLFEEEFLLDNYVYDFKVRDILIEIDPTPTHNSTWSPFGDYTGLADTYHINKSRCAEEHKYRCIHVWDWDSFDSIISLLKDKERLYARNLEIKEVAKDVCNSFLNKYHLQGTCKGQDICLGLYKEDTLIQVMTFGKPRYNKNYEYELLRLCTNSNYIVIGGAQKLFKNFLIRYKPLSIISYCDRSKFTGNVYKQLGFLLKDSYKPSKHWYNMKTGKHITDNLLRQRGFDQLLGREYGYYGKGTSNEELMLSHDFVEIYDAGQATYVWRGNL